MFKEPRRICRKITRLTSFWSEVLFVFITDGHAGTTFFQQGWTLRFEKVSDLVSPTAHSQDKKLSRLWGEIFPHKKLKLTMFSQINRIGCISDLIWHVLNHIYSIISGLSRCQMVDMCWFLCITFPFSLQFPSLTN